MDPAPKKPSRGSSKSVKTSLIFPVHKVKSLLRQGRIADRITDSGAIYMTAVLQYVTAEILELAHAEAQTDRGTGRIQARDIYEAIAKDPELGNRLRLASVTERGSGCSVLPGMAGARGPAKPLASVNAEPRQVPMTLSSCLASLPAFPGRESRIKDGVNSKNASKSAAVKSSAKMRAGGGKSTSKMVAANSASKVKRKPATGGGKVKATAKPGYVSLKSLVSAGLKTIKRTQK